ncbi:MAG TPA: hypothetical protein VLM84_08640 [Chromatiaceae bacterium]|nr:hypothetical protein [Chromatiaceae bacterium]
MKPHALIAAAMLALVAVATRAQDPWIGTGADGQPEVQLYFFWARTCPHCIQARPFI